MNISQRKRTDPSHRLKQSHFYLRSQTDFQAKLTPFWLINIYLQNTPNISVESVQGYRVKEETKAQIQQCAVNLQCKCKEKNEESIATSTAWASTPAALLSQVELYYQFLAGERGINSVFLCPIVATILQHCPMSKCITLSFIFCPVSIVVVQILRNGHTIQKKGIRASLANI